MIAASPLAATIAITGAIDASTLAAIEALPAVASGLIVLNVGQAMPFERPRVCDVVEFVAFHTGVSRANIISHTRSVAFLRARFAAAWGARLLSGRAYAVIGASMGDRDHSTIMYAVRQAERMRATDPSFRCLTNRLAAHFGGVPA